MILTEWPSHVSGGLRCFVSVQLEIGLVIPDMPVFIDKNGHPFVVLPSKPIVANGRLKTGADGKPEYRPAVYWSDRRTSDKFSAAVIKLLLAKHPNALSAAPARSQIERAAEYLRP
jgi:hypothetical protein